VSGTWNLRNKQFLQPIVLKKWCVANFLRGFSRQQVEDYIASLKEAMVEKGMEARASHKYTYYHHHHCYHYYHQNNTTTTTTTIVTP